MNIGDPFLPNLAGGISHAVWQRAGVIEIDRPACYLSQG